MYVDFLSSLHKKTERDYLARVNGFPKDKAAELAKQWGFDYWDGSRDTGYGGYHYDGRWSKVAKEMIDYYHLKSAKHILDVGCGKGFLLYEMKKILPELVICGIDISDYAVINSKEEIRNNITIGNARILPFDDKEFDLVISINTLHNLLCFDMKSALQEISRVGSQNYICVESFRNEKEKVNLLYWQLTCKCFFSPEEWHWWFKESGYNGDYSFIYFE